MPAHDAKLTEGQGTGIKNAVVRKAYAGYVIVDCEFQAKTNRLLQEKIGTYGIERVDELLEIDADTIELIKSKHGDRNLKKIAIQSQGPSLGG